MQTLGSGSAERAEAVQSVGRLSGTGPFFSRATAGGSRPASGGEKRAGSGLM